MQRRCLVPAAAYYEWRDDPDGKIPFAVARRDGTLIAFAGIWEKWRSPEGEALQTFATTTTEANRQFSAIQDRMPVILERADWPVWLGEEEGDVAALLRPAGEDVLRVWPVDRKRQKRQKRQKRRPRPARARQAARDGPAVAVNKRAARWPVLRDVMTRGCRNATLSPHAPDSDCARSWRQRPEWSGPAAIADNAQARV